MKFGSGKRGYVLLDCLLAVLISSFVGAVLLGTFVTALTCWEFVSDVRAAWVKSERIFLVIGSRVVNAGLDVSPQVFMEGSTSLLPDWESALEILDSGDKRAPFQDIDGEQVARGARMRVLSASIAVTNYLISSDGWKNNTSTNFPVPLFNPKGLGWWWAMPSFGVPFMVQPDKKTIVNLSGKTWRGVDMPHTFRIAYFHVEKDSLGEDVFYIRDSADRDTTRATVPKLMHKEPIVNDIIAARFELNKTKKTLTAWVSVATSKNSQKVREISRTWRIRNLHDGGN